MNNFFNRTLFFIGWLLSPFTFWNDAFINIPISYLAASLLSKFIHAKFVLLTIVCYWASNVLGLAIMYIAGKGVMAKGKSHTEEGIKLIVTMAAYTAVLFFLNYMGLLRPIRGV